MLKIELKVKDIINEANGKLICGNEDMVCGNFSKDTRQIKSGDVYLGIKGERFNRKYILQASLRKRS